MAKTLEDIRFCKLSEKVVAEQPQAFVKSVSKPKYVCLKCFRVSAHKENLCRPQKLKKIASEAKKHEKRA